MDKDPSAIGNPLADILGLNSEGPLAGYSILLAESHFESKIATETMLKRLDANVITVSSIDEIDSVSKSKYLDVVITEYNLTDGDGFDVVRKVLGHPGNSDLRLYCHTSDQNCTSNETAQTMFNAIVSKPSKEEEWVKLILSQAPRKKGLTLIK